MDTNTIKEFFGTWSVYNRVLELNYMFHDEIYREVATVLRERFASRPFSIVDLGCGSAQHLARALKGRNVSRYLGYDLSEPALKAARQNLAPLHCPMEFKQGDFFDGLRADAEKFSLIFSSFALHHLTRADKERFFQITRQRLDAAGVLLLIDVAREANEDRAAYLNNYCGWIQSDWSALSQPALDSILDHIRQNDFPETDDDLLAMAAKAGFARGRTKTHFRWHHAWEFDGAGGWGSSRNATAARVVLPRRGSGRPILSPGRLDAENAQLKPQTHQLAQTVNKLNHEINEGAR